MQKPEVHGDRPFTIAVAPTFRVPGAVSEAVHQESVAAQSVHPLAAYLERWLGRPVRLVLEPNYLATVEALRQGRVDAAMLGDAASRKAQEGGGIEPLLIPVGADGSRRTYQSAILTRIDSGIHDLRSLRGATFGLVDEQSTSGYLVPRAMLREAGIDPDRDVRTRLLGDHKSVAEAVIAGEIVAGAVHGSALEPPSLDRGADYARLRILAWSRPIESGPLVVRSGLSPSTRAALTRAMLGVHEADPSAAAVLFRHGYRFTHADRRSTPTLKSIAALAGVSYGTVSRVINGQGEVAPATAARVAAIVEELGYRPASSAMSVRGRRQPVVGLLTLPHHDPVIDVFANVLQAPLAEAGVPLVLCRASPPLAGSLFLDLLRDGRLGALVVTAAHAADPDLAAVARTGKPVVVAGVQSGAPGTVVATLDEAASVVLSVLGLTAPSDAPSPEGNAPHRSTGE